MKVNLVVNGTPEPVYCDPSDTLLEVLRDRMEMKEVKIGCLGGECGSCTVLLDGEAVNSCLVLAAEADGASVTTSRGLGKEALSPLQAALVEAGGVQCGFCTPGLVLTATAYLRENPRPSDEEIRRNLLGNLCRCTGYQAILEAIRAVSEGTPGIDE